MIRGMPVKPRGIPLFIPAAANAKAAKADIEKNMSS